MTEPLWTGTEWTFPKIERVYQAIEKIAVDELRLEPYPAQLEIITSEQMVDAYCFAPHHHVLRQDLRWIEAGHVEVGDIILGFDEHGPHRCFRPATVLRVGFTQEPIYRVELASGDILHVTKDHQWLVRMSRGLASHLKWRTTARLRDRSCAVFTPSRIPKVMERWTESTTKEAGWIAGIFDGEGNILKGGLRALAFAQNEGEVLSNAQGILEAQGFQTSIYDRSHATCKRLAVLGTVADKMRMLGENRPERLINQLDFNNLGLMKTDDHYEVVSIEEAGVGEIVQITTSTGTLVVDGYPMHNCSIGMPIFYHHWSFGKLFTSHWSQYQKGMMGLAYEIVINCLKHDTRVIAKDRGIITIDAVDTGDLIWNGSEYVAVSRVHRSRQMTYDIQLSCGLDLSCTNEHRHLVCSDTGIQIKKTSQLTLEDYLLIPVSGAATTDQEADLVAFQYFPPRTGFGETYGYMPYCTIPAQMNPDLAELIGIILGNGCMSHTLGTSFYISVGHTSPGYDAYVLDLIKRVFSLEDVYVREKESTRVAGKYNKDIYICCDEIKAFLNFCGLHRVTAKNKRIPWTIWQSSRRCQMAFLRGLFDTDGNASRVGFSCYNEKLGQDLGILLWSLGFANTVRRVDNDHNNIQTIDFISDGKRAFAEQIDSRNAAKRTVLMEVLHRNPDFAADSSELSKLPRFYLEKYNNGAAITRAKLLKREAYPEIRDYRFSRITAISEAAEVDVVDVTVASDDHIFWANGMLTHNSNPCIAYLMEENTMTMHALTISHASFGHSHFFRNNYLFRQWTDAEAIIDYLVFARNYIKKCEVREGTTEVELFLDSCHALMDYGINRFKRPSKLSAAKEKQREEARDAYHQSQVNELSEFFNSLQTKTPGEVKKPFPAEPEENLLYFCEKYAPDLPEWKREVIRIVRKIAQYFYPQGLTKVGNEGTATYVHYRIMNRLHELGVMTDAAMLEFLRSHTNVVFQPGFDDERYSGINPYALGFAIMRDIERICWEPTDEDRDQFDFAGCRDEMNVLKDAWADYRDESLIRQFLSRKVMRDMDLFQLKDNRAEPQYLVTAIHNDQGYERIRETLANSYERHQFVPQIEVVKVDPDTRQLSLQYKPYLKRPLANAEKMLKHVQNLWGHGVVLYDDKNNKLAAS